MSNIVKYTTDTLTATISGLANGHHASSYVFYCEDPFLCLGCHSDITEHDFINGEKITYISSNTNNFTFQLPSYLLVNDNENAGYYTDTYYPDTYYPDTYYPGTYYPDTYYPDTYYTTYSSHPYTFSSYVLFNTGLKSNIASSEVEIRQHASPQLYIYSYDKSYYYKNSGKYNYSVDMWLLSRIECFYTFDNNKHKVSPYNSDIYIDYTADSETNGFLSISNIPNSNDDSYFTIYASSNAYIKEGIDITTYIELISNDSDCPQYIKQNSKETCYLRLLNGITSIVLEPYYDDNTEVSLDEYSSYLINVNSGASLKIGAFCDTNKSYGNLYNNYIASYIETLSHNNNTKMYYECEFGDSSYYLYYDFLKDFMDVEIIPIGTKNSQGVFNLSHIVGDTTISLQTSPGAPNTFTESWGVEITTNSYCWIGKEVRISVKSPHLITSVQQINPGDKLTLAIDDGVGHVKEIKLIRYSDKKETIFNGDNMLMKYDPNNPSANTKELVIPSDILRTDSNGNAIMERFYVEVTPFNGYPIKTLINIVPIIIDLS